MELTSEITNAILFATSKALATTGKHGINVVPVSTIRIVDNKILLMNYFLNKTLDNVLENPNVSLVCWKGLGGYQIKGSVEYVDTGTMFEEAKEWVVKNVPSRNLKGLLILEAKEICDVSPK